jgi:hypothetical protein
MENFTAKELVYEVYEHYDEIAKKCYKIIQEHSEQVSITKIKDYINNDVIKRILIARQYEENKAVEMWKKWFVSFYNIGMAITV